MLNRFVDSVLTTADFPDEVEFIVYIDEDDHSYDGWEHPYQVKIRRGVRKNLSQCYEYERATGDILMMGGDDMVFHTKRWDSIVKKAFDLYSDKIVLVYGDDGDPNHESYGTAPFIHRNWVKVVGRYLPPYFSGDFTDTWLNAVADALGRKMKVDIYTEHIHPAFGKRERDDTDNAKWHKHFRDDMPGKYLDTLDERVSEIKKLRKFIQNFK